MAIYRLKGTSGALLNQSFPLAGELRLGPGEDCDVTVESEEGDGVLAVVTVRDDGSVHLSALSGDAVTVNGDAVRELSLAGGDELRVGRSGAWRWWLAAAVVAAAGAAVAWWQGWIPLP